MAEPRVYVTQPTGEWSHLGAALWADPGHTVEILPEELAARYNELAASLAKVRELHQPGPERNCQQCVDTSWPCPTIQALGETDHG